MRVKGVPVQITVPPLEVVMIGVGFGLTITLIGIEIPEQPLLSKANQI
jgi:hypothetical protein